MNSPKTKEYQHFLLRMALNLILLPNEISKATPMNLSLGKKGEASKK